MRVAALYDIHGNLPALEAVIEDARYGRADRIVVGGDIVPGPEGGEAIELLLNLEIPVDFLQGNGEVAVLAAEDRLEPMPEQAREIVRRGARELSDRHREIMAGWPKMLRLAIEGIGDVLFCHGTPRHENEIFTRHTDEKKLIPLFQNLGVSLVVCGHTHMPFDRMIGESRVVNAGSVGMPFGAPGAYWLLLDGEVRPRRTLYDLERASERIRATNRPGADEFARNGVLNPPSEEVMLEVFSRAELRYETAR